MIAGLFVAAVAVALLLASARDGHRTQKTASRIKEGQ